MRLVQELDEHRHWLLEAGRRHCCLLAKHSEAASLSTEKYLTQLWASGEDLQGEY